MGTILCPWGDCPGEVIVLIAKTFSVEMFSSAILPVAPLCGFLREENLCPFYSCPTVAQGLGIL